MIDNLNTTQKVIRLVMQMIMVGLYKLNPVDPP
jgi:hypothetical protein